MMIGLLAPARTRMFALPGTGCGSSLTMGRLIFPKSFFAPAGLMWLACRLVPAPDTRFRPVPIVTSVNIIDEEQSLGRNSWRCRERIWKSVGRAVASKAMFPATGWCLWECY